jgi:carbonic anhydrase/acetyltransferase-like protein (isoleucine patch superfamily)
MTVDDKAHVITVGSTATPVIDSQAWIAAGAVIAGHVNISAYASIWYNCVLRADGAQISVGERTNLQDAVVCHADDGFSVRLGTGVSVGHAAVLHGCTIEEDSLIGMNATVLSGAVIGSGSVIAAGAVVLEGTIVPPRSLVAGVPGRVHRQLSDKELEGVQRNAENYVELMNQHRRPTQSQ